MKTRFRRHIPIAAAMGLALASSAVGQGVFSGADESTSSRSEYFSWIDNTNEGTTEGQTLANLDFFGWLKSEYGMQLDIYAFDAGAIDGPRYYGSTESEKFRAQFPRGFGPMYERAKEYGIRLGIWGGPDGFGDIPEEEAARTEMMVSLCRDYEFALFKFDAVAGQLRADKQEAFGRMMDECRRYSPDLILLNHRLNLGPARVYATTTLWEGAETYIDVFMTNTEPAPHHRGQAISRGLPPNLMRLTEDHGVNLSSALDYWEDDLVLQAFNRSLILAPQLYGSPWFLRDDEYPGLARIFNLHRRYRDILVSGIVLPEDRYGPHAVSRGDGDTRLVTLRNLTWEPVRYSLEIGEVLGLESGEVLGLESGGPFEVRTFHPTERIVGHFEIDDEVEIEVLPYRSALILVTSEPVGELGIEGVDFRVVKDTGEGPVVVRLLGLPGTSATIRLADDPTRSFSSARLEGKVAAGFEAGQALRVEFAGASLTEPYHRRLAELDPVPVPFDAEALYEATVYAADNNALEIRSLQRAGRSEIPRVRAARDAFRAQRLLVDRALWDRYAFDGDPDSFFDVWSFGRDIRVNGGALRLDLGSVERPTRISLEIAGNGGFQDLVETGSVVAEVSADLLDWLPVDIAATGGREPGGTPAKDSQHERVLERMRALGPFTRRTYEISVPEGQSVRYVRVRPGPQRVAEIRAYVEDRELGRERWRASNLFGPYVAASAVRAWGATIRLDEAAVNSYLAIPIYGEHGVEGAYAALRVNGELRGAPDRAGPYPTNVWEYLVAERESGYTYYVPVTRDMIGASIDVVVLGLNPAAADLRAEVWITAYPAPLAELELTLKP